MQQIFSYFWQMCLLRASPSRIPGSLFVLGLIFGIYAVMSLLTMVVTESITLPFMLVALLVSVSVQAGLLYGLLWFKGVRQRFAPTLAALLGTTSVLLLIMLPANMIFVNVDTPVMRVIAGALFLSTFVWRLAISGAILSKAARISMLQGAAIMFVMQMITLTINQGLLP